MIFFTIIATSVDFSGFRRVKYRQSAPHNVLEPFIGKGVPTFVNISEPPHLSKTLAAYHRRTPTPPQAICRLRVSIFTFSRLGR